MSGELAELTQILVDEGITQGEAAIGGAATGGILGFLSAVFGSIASRKFGNDLRKACFSKAIHFSCGYKSYLSTRSHYQYI